MPDHRWINIGDGRSVYRKAGQEPRRQRSTLPSPMLIRDEMDPTEHVDGRLYTSKSKFRQTTRAHGLVEMGDDPARKRPAVRQKPKPGERREAIQRAEHALRNGMKPPTQTR